MGAVKTNVYGLPLSCLDSVLPGGAQIGLFGQDGLECLLTNSAPQVIGKRLSVGLGDRLGLATPGHIRAVRGTGVAPYLCQQSIREMTRTQRSPDDVMDDASWGVMEEGYRDGFAGRRPDPA